MTDNQTSSTPRWVRKLLIPALIGGVAGFAASAGMMEFIDSSAVGGLDLSATVAALACAPEDLLVWLGPAIGPQAFEVGPEVREAFVQQLPGTAQAFVPSRNPGKFMADIYKLARLRLAARGVTAVYGGGLCTVTDPRFFSYRRSPRTGRFASLIWLER